VTEHRSYVVPWKPSVAAEASLTLCVFRRRRDSRTKSPGLNDRNVHQFESLCNAV